MFLAQAYEELAKGDLAQASKKGWDAAAQMVKAIADERGWEHEGFRDLLIVGGKLYLETSDSELSDKFDSAILLHTNLYEFGNVYSVGFIKHTLQDVKGFVERAERLLGATTISQC